jgi:formate dehydrogenase maturation protein FdhE
MTKHGYKNPPMEHQFKKGKSGNPKGRPRKKKQSSSDPGLDLIASVHRELRKSVFVQENGKHREITKLDAFSAQLVAQSVNGKPSQQKMLLSLLTLHKHEETEQQTLEQLQTYDEDLLNDLYDQLNSMNDDIPDDIDDQGDDVYD